MSENNFYLPIDPELERKINEMYAKLMDSTKSTKQSLSEDWLQIIDIAEILGGVDPKTVRRHLKNAGLEGKKLGRKLYFHREQVEKLLGR